MIKLQHLQRIWKAIQRWFLFEAFIIFLMVLTFNNFLGNPTETIRSDGFGYYDYLVSTFIEHDLVRKDLRISTHPEAFQRSMDLENGKVAFGIYLPYGDQNVNKYSCGMAMLVSPFFLGALWLEGAGEVTGYEPIFQKAVMFAALFYVFLALLFYRRLCSMYDLKPWTIRFTQLLMVFATGVMHYAYFDAGFSHVYSLFAVTAFFFFATQWFRKHRSGDLLLAALMLGAVFLLRQINVLVIFALPFFVGSFDQLKRGVLAAWSRPKTLLLAVFVVLVTVSIQFIFWYLQTGDFILYSYREEGFDFLHPEVINLLFSYQKGLFVYYPILLFSIIAVVLLWLGGRVFEAISWLGFFALVVYVFSAWWSWDYGACFGQRPFIDLYSFFFLAMAMALSSLSLIKALVVGGFMVLTVPVALIQTYQYQHFILHWYRMNEEKYWKVFLETDLRYRYYIWGRKIPLESSRLLHREQLAASISGKEGQQTIFRKPWKELGLTENFDFIALEFQSDFQEDEPGSLLLQIHDTITNVVHFSHAIPVFHFKVQEFGTYSYGYHQFKMVTPGRMIQKEITLQLLNPTPSLKLDDVWISFYQRGKRQ